MRTLLIILLTSARLGAAQSSPSEQTEPGIAHQRPTGVPYCDNTRGQVELGSDSMGADMKPYLAGVISRVRSNWTNGMPRDAYPPMRKSGQVTIELVARQDGRVDNLRIVQRSGEPSLDRAAWAGIVASNPFPPLPKDFESPYVSMRFHFCYNLDPPSADLADSLRSAAAALKIGDYTRAIQLYSGLTQTDAVSLDTWEKLARAYRLNGMYEKAEATYRRIDFGGSDQLPHYELGRLYAVWNKYDKALPEFVQAASIMPYDARLQVDLGTAYLNTGQDDKALASFDTAVKLWDGPTIWNSIAYQLALRNSHLDRARQYAESAVSARATALRNVDMATATPHDFWRVGALASYWDTLGWVFFALKDPDTAEKYVSSSWKLRQLSSSADLLGQIYEKRGQRDRAIEAYAWALAGEHAPNSAVSRRLAALLGGEDKVAGEVAKHRDGVLAAQTTHLDARGPANADGEFVVMIASGGGTPTQDARVVDGDPRLKILEEPLRTAKFDITFPPGPPTKIFLHGTVSCSGSGECSFVRSWQVRPEPSN